jgi:HD-GYP domain-containing protein (c-di-GMP phosphodiesterase class II)
MSARYLKPGTGERLHQFVVGFLPVIAYLTGRLEPIYVSVALSLGAMLSVRLVLVQRLGDLLHPPPEDSPDAFFHDGVRRFDEATRAVLLGVGLAALLSENLLGWLPVLAAASISTLAATTGFAFTTVLYAFITGVLRRVYRWLPEPASEDPSVRGNPQCLVCRSLGTAPYQRCTWCRLTTVRSCCVLQTSLVMALLLVIGFLLTAEMGAFTTKLLVTLSILSVVALALVVTRQTEDLVNTLEVLAEEHRRTQRRCEFLRRLTKAESVEDAAREAVAFTASALHTRRISVMAVENDVLRIIASQGIPQGTVDQVAVPIGQRICGRVFATGAPVVLNDVGAEKFGETLGLNSGEAMASYPLLVAPMETAGRKVGVLNVTDARGGEFGAADLAELRFISEATAITLAGQMSRRESEHANYASIVTLALAMEAKDPYTNGHSHRVLDWSAAVARDLGLSGSRFQSLRHAAELHDIGKLAIPDGILKAPRRLTPVEWSVVREHPRRGVTLVHHLPFLKPACDAILHHHEHLDGSGYPGGLRHEEIPLEARIIAVIDAYDAMTSERPYRPPLSHDEATAELRRMTGRQFDPQCVGAFLRVMERELPSPEAAVSAARTL